MSDSNQWNISQSAIFHIEELIDFVLGYYLQHSIVDNKIDYIATEKMIHKAFLNYKRVLTLNPLINRHRLSTLLCKSTKYLLYTVLKNIDINVVYPNCWPL